MVQFRRSRKLGPLRFTISQRGLGISIGVGPLRVSFNADGKIRRTTRVAGVWSTKVVGKWR